VVDEPRHERAVQWRIGRHVTQGQALDGVGLEYVARDRVGHDDVVLGRTQNTEIVW